MKLAEPACYLSTLTEAMVWHYMVFDRLSWNNSWSTRLANRRYSAILGGGRTINPQGSHRTRQFLVGHPDQVNLISAHLRFPFTENSQCPTTHMKTDRKFIFYFWYRSNVHIEGQRDMTTITQHILPRTWLRLLLSWEKYRNKEQMLSLKQAVSITTWIIQL